MSACGVAWRAAAGSDGSTAHADLLTDVVAMDGLGIIGTFGFFVEVPAPAGAE